MGDSTQRRDQVRQIGADRSDERGPLLEVLLAIQREFGWIDEDDLPVVARVLHLSRAEVHGVVGFYDDLRTTPPPTHVVRLCRAEACRSVGAQGLFEHAQHTLAGQDDIEVQQVFCFGNCALGPSGTIDGTLYGRLDVNTLESLVAQVRS